MSEYTFFDRWTVKRKTFWWVFGGGLGAIIILAFLYYLFAGFFFGGMSADYATDDYYGYETIANSAGMGFNDAVAEEMEKGFDVMDESRSPEPQAFNGEITDTSYDERMIIREGNITLPVESTRSSRDAIEALVASFADQGAYIVSSNEYAYYEDSEPNINMTIRIPVDQFEFVMDELSDLAVGNVTLNTWSDDVSERYNDLENRLESLEAARLRLLDIMANADNTEDLLAAEQQLTYRESEIESIKGSMKFLSASSDLSRISIYLEPYILSQPIETKWAPLETIRYAFESLLHSLQSFADWLIVFVIATLPWLILIGIVIWLIVRRAKKKNKKKAE
jgi:hypothetical protein